MKDTKHFLVVGAGLAGVCVSAHLIKKGAKVTLVDNGVNHSSLVAAGLITPLVFRRMNKNWRADDFISYHQSFYREMETLTESSFFHSLKIRRMFSSEQERGYWIKKQEQEEYCDYMHQLTSEDDSFDRAINNFGSGRLKNAAYVDTSVFLESMKAYIGNHGSLLNERLDYDLLNNTSYKNITYDHIVFCEGYLGKNNPWFGSLPLGQTKGETLTIKSTDIPEDESVNRKCFVLPLGNHTFKVGSTYVWENTSVEPTEEGKLDILEKLSYLTNAPIEVINQGAGIRPTTMDRRPLIGTHPDHNHYHIFNGLGTKGYMIAPKLSAEFVNYLIDGVALDKDVLVSRYEMTY